MRWDDLFEDLAARMAADEEAALRFEVADRTRGEFAALDLLDRFGAHRGERLRIAALGAGIVDGVVADVAAQWLLVEEGGARQALIPTAAMLWIEGIGRRSSPAEGSALSRRFGLGAALRGLARHRTVVRLYLRDGQQLAGTLDRVGADHVDLAQHATDLPRRATDVGTVRVIPLGALALVRSAG